ncbi:MAG: efflux RND transporter permease subunit [Thermoanaerobaculia bacterium]
MNLLDFVQRQRRAFLLLTGALSASGILLAWFLPSSIYPDLTFPRILIIGKGGTLPPRATVLAMTRPLEEAAMGTQGIRRVRSRTFRGVAEVSAQFAPGSDMKAALQQMQNRVAEARGELPPGSEVEVELLTGASFPMLSLNLTGPLPIADLRDDAYYLLRPALSRVPGVGRVEVLASDSREIEVIVNPSRLMASGLTAADVARGIADANRLVSVGTVVDAGSQQVVLASGLLSSVEEIGQTPLTKADGAAGAIVRVRDVAEVVTGTPDRTQLVAGNGQPAAILNVAQQPGANILDVRTGVEDALRRAAADLPSGLSLQKVYDLAELVSNAISNVRDAILSGGLLAVLVLFIFLRDWRLTAVAGLTLPLTVLCTFPFLHFFGESINLMSMGGLAVAIGLVIDDAVVVVENLHRHRQMSGGSARQAIAELVAPLVGSTLTTVVVLLPLGLLSGVAGDFFRALSTTLSVAVLLSLGLALSVIPILAEKLAPSPTRTAALVAVPLLRESGYVRSLRAFLLRPFWVAACVVGLVLAGGLLLATSPTGFLPEMDEGGFVIDYLTPPGTALAETDRQVQALETVLAHTPEVAAMSRRTGSELGLFATEPNKGDILVRLVPRSDRELEAEEIIAALRPRLAAAAPGLDLQFLELLQDMIGDLEGETSPIEVKVFGDDPTALAKTGEELSRRMKNVPGIVDVVGVGAGSAERTWRIDAGAAARFGLTVDDVSRQIAACWRGEIAGDLVRGDRTVPIRVRCPDDVRFDPTKLGAIALRNPAGGTAPLSSIARVEVATAESGIVRENLRQMIQVTGRLGPGRDLGGAVGDLRKALASLTVPLGEQVEVGGQLAAQRRAFLELLLVFALAVLLVLVVLIAQFRSFGLALLILLAAPLALAGALLLLRFTGTDLNVSSAMGLILLVGLVVKNGIVLLDCAERRRSEGSPRIESIVSAAGIRLRPIVMTTLCTLLGLLPLALGLGAGAELQRPLALAVIGGLGLSTLVTLYVIPALYLRLGARASGPEPS